MGDGEKKGGKERHQGRMEEKATGGELHTGVLNHQTIVENRHFSMYIFGGGSEKNFLKDGCFLHKESLSAVGKPLCASSHLVPPFLFLSLLMLVGLAHKKRKREEKKRKAEEEERRGAISRGIYILYVRCLASREEEEEEEEEEDVDKEEVVVVVVGEEPHAMNFIVGLG